MGPELIALELNGLIEMPEGHDRVLPFVCLLPDQEMFNAVAG